MASGSLGAVQLVCLAKLYEPRCADQRSTRTHAQQSGRALPCWWKPVTSSAIEPNIVEIERLMPGRVGAAIAAQFETELFTHPVAVRVEAPFD